MILFGLGAGVTSAYAAPASGALIGQLVSRRDLPSAVALNSMTYNLARAVGPVLAAVTVHALGIPAAFAINSASYLALVAGLLVVHARPQERPPREESRLGASLRFVWERPNLLALLLIITAVGFASDPVNTEAPAFAHAFGEPDTKAGFIVGVFGAGAVVAALTLAGRVAGSRMRMAVTLTLLGGGVIAFSLSPLALARVRVPLRRRLRIPRVEHVGDDAAPARGRGVAARADHGAVERRVPRAAADRELRRRRARRRFGVRVAGVVLALPALVAAGLIVRLRDRRLRRAEPLPAPEA